MHKPIAQHKTYPSKKQPTRFRVRILPVVVIMSIVGLLYVYSVLHKPLPDLSYTPVPVHVAPETPSISIDWPSKGQGAVGSVEEGVVAQSQSQFEQVPIASTAKVITALAVMRAKPFRSGSGQDIKLNEKDVDLYNYYLNLGGSVAPVQNGQIISEKDALSVMLLPSANNMADSLALWAFGSMDAYKLYAQKMVKDYGAFQTTVDDASGFSSGTTSTARDLVLLGQRLMRDPILRTIVALPVASVPTTGLINNTNQLLGFNGAIGIKTGHTTEAGGCLLYAQNYTVAPGHTVTLLAAVLGAETVGQSFAVTSSIVTTTVKGYGKTVLLPANTPVGIYRAPWTKTTEAVTANALETYGWTASKHTVKTGLDIMKVPVLKNQEIGTVTAQINSIPTSVPVKAAASVPPPSLWWRLIHNR